MKYQKKPLSIDKQIEKLEHRGLIFDDKNIAYEYLSNNSYYRLRAYTYPFQDNENDDANHRFIRNDIRFDEIIELYSFDRKLRILMFSAIEKIEIALRTKLSQVYCESMQDSHWYVNRSLFAVKKTSKNGKKADCFDLLYSDTENEIKISNEYFIKHYFLKYTSPSLPPAWMTLEVLSLGTLSKMYTLLNKTPEKMQIANAFGLPNDRILSNWLHAIAVLRNCCAHHSRIWNRRYVINIILSYNTKYPFINKKDIKNIRNNKFFTVVSCVKYLLDVIDPDNEFKGNLMSIMSSGGKLLNLKDMGFPENWNEFPIWNLTN